MEDLTDRIASHAKGLGATLIGFAPSERFQGALTGHGPEDWVPGARSVVAIGMAIPNAFRDWSGWLEGSPEVPPENRLPLAQHYLYTTAAHDVINVELDRIALKLSQQLDEEGYLSMFIPSQYSPRWEKVRKYVPSGKGLFSHRHAAVLSGLGEFGLNNVVITPRYGPMVRWVSVITTAPLRPDPLLEKKACLGPDCGQCVDQCCGAIQVLDDIDPQAVWIEPPARTDIEHCLREMPKRICYGLCVRVCPVGLERFGRTANVQNGVTPR